MKVDGTTKTRKTQVMMVPTSSPREERAVSLGNEMIHSTEEQALKVEANSNKKQPEAAGKK